MRLERSVVEWPLWDQHATTTDLLVDVFEGIECLCLLVLDYSDLRVDVC